jgi:hypothetical protein
MSECKISAFGGLFDTVEAKVLEIMLSDPARTWKPLKILEDFPGLDMSAVAKVFCQLHADHMLTVNGEGYVLNTTSKRVRALSLLTLATLDDERGTHYMTTLIKEACQRRPVFDPPV